MFLGFSTIYINYFKIYKYIINFFSYSNHFKTLFADLKNILLNLKAMKNSICYINYSLFSNK